MPPMIPVLPTDPQASTLYLDWVREHDPAAEPDAEKALAALADGLGRAHRKPGRFLDDMKREARRLPDGHLPWFWDTVGHRLSGLAPRHAATAYADARDAEGRHGLPVDEGYRLDNTLLFARAGALGAKQVRAHQAWLAATYPPDRAHREFVRFVAAWGSGGAAPSADLHQRLRASAKAAGLGLEEDAEVLGQALARARGTAVPDGLLDGAAKVFAKAPPPPAFRADLAEIFPTGDTDGAAWLRMLDAAGVIEAMASGQVGPSGGLAGWLGRYAFHYSFSRVAYGGIMQQQMPDELYAVLPRLAPRLRAEAVPVRLHESRFRGATHFDADLVDACLAEGVPVEDPAERASLTFWGDRSHRDMKALAADPVLGGRLEGTVHAALRHGTAISRLPESPGVEKAVHERLSALIDQVAGAGLGTAAEAVAALDGLLDPPTIAALDGLGEALDGLDLAAPLARTLRAGIPAELGWPALDSALADLGDDLAGATSSWPVLTVYGRSRAIAVDHAGRRGECAFTLPADTTLHTVHHVGGDHLVGYSLKEGTGSVRRAFWASAPADVFEPENTLGMLACQGPRSGGFGYHFELSGGRYDGERVLLPGGREGIGGHERQLSDGVRIWSASRFVDSAEDWSVLDIASGERGPAGSLPDAAPSPPPEGEELELDLLSLVRLPEEVTGSPLGQSGGLAGFRVTRQETERSRPPSGWTIEGADGRRARLRYDRKIGDPWGVVRMPAGGSDLIMAWDGSNAFVPMPCYDASDNTLLWEGRAFPDPKSPMGADPRNRPMLPPPAFWHFLVPRDLDSSRALRATTEDAARALLAAGDVPAALAEVMPGVTEPAIVDGVVAMVRRAADVLRKRQAASRRVEAVRSGASVRPAAQTPDADLLPALRGLVPPLPRHVPQEPSPRPATVSAIAADGRFLAGGIDDQTRLLSPPAPPFDWVGLVGAVDAVAWRLVAPSTGDRDRASLAALLRTWADQPFARPGTWRRGYATGAALAPLSETGGTVITGIVRPADPARSYRFLQTGGAPEPDGAKKVQTATVARDDAARLVRLLELLKEHGPLPLDKDAVAAFSARTGVRRAIAALVLDGLPRRAEVGGDRMDRFEAHGKMLRGKPYSASKAVAEEAEHLARRLDFDGRLRVLAAAMPDDPADLWADGGLVAAAERMAAVWVELLGGRTPVDEDAAAELESDLGYGDGWLPALADPSTSSVATEDVRCVIAERKPGDLEIYPVASNGSIGRRIYSDPYTGIAAVLVWALTQRPVGDPACAGAAELHDRLRARLDAPDLLLPLRVQSFSGGRAARFGPRTVPVRRATDKAVTDELAEDDAYDNGLIIVSGAGGSLKRPLLRPSGFADPDALPRLERLCADHDMPDLLLDVQGVKLRYDGAIARMIARAADTPVPAGGYEANPLLSVPDLVAEAAARTGTSAEAAALYLQLLTLARPTDRNVRKWNGWSAAAHKAAQDELVGHGLVQQDKRARAGRTAFIPGGWTQVKAPDLPLETAKLAPHLATVRRDKQIQCPF
ncbi:hypothetical protein, partial [Actinomadura rubrisoli]